MSLGSYVSMLLLASLVVDQDFMHAEFRLDRRKRPLRMRSALRIGYWDFGVSSGACGA
jgi:uncharacterized protein (DUF1499 family)